MKKIIKILLCLTLILTTAVMFSACGLTSNASGNSITVGDYYLFDKDKTEESNKGYDKTKKIVVLDAKLWSDNDNKLGIYTVETVDNSSDYKVTFYDANGENVYVCTYAKNQLTLESGSVYKIEETTTSSSWTSWLPIIIIAVLFIAYFVWQSISNKKRQKKAQEKVDSLKVGDRVKTIGGICGFVSEINNEENTFVLETESNGNKSYIKLDRMAIYQTAPNEGANVQEKKEGKKPE